MSSRLYIRKGLVEWTAKLLPFAYAWATKESREVPALAELVTALEFAAIISGLVFIGHHMALCPP